jgi:hypothetical protein
MADSVIVNPFCLKSPEAPERSKVAGVVLLEVTPVFERYTEKARRITFFARYEASQFGSP